MGSSAIIGIDVFFFLVFGGGFNDGMGLLKARATKSLGMYTQR